MLPALQARMGIKIEVLDPTPDCPASMIAKQTLGSFKEPASIRYNDSVYPSFLALWHSG